MTVCEEPQGQGQVSHPPLENLYRLAETTLAGAERQAAVHLDAVRDAVAERAIDFSILTTRGWSPDVLAIQAERRARAVEKAAGYCRRVLEVSSVTGQEAGRLLEESGEAMAEQGMAMALEASARVGQALASLQSAWIDSVSAFGSLQYCPLPRRRTP